MTWPCFLKIPSTKPKKKKGCKYKSSIEGKATVDVNKNVTAATITYAFKCKPSKDRPHAKGWLNKKFAMEYVFHIKFSSIKNNRARVISNCGVVAFITKNGNKYTIKPVINETRPFKKATFTL